MISLDHLETHSSKIVNMLKAFLCVSVLSKIFTVLFEIINLSDWFGMVKMKVQSSEYIGLIFILNQLKWSLPFIAFQSLGSTQKSTLSQDISSPPLPHTEEDHVYRSVIWQQKQMDCLFLYSDEASSSPTVILVSPTSKRHHQTPQHQLWALHWAATCLSWIACYWNSMLFSRTHHPTPPQVPTHMYTPQYLHHIGAKNKINKALD